MTVTLKICAKHGLTKYIKQGISKTRCSACNVEKNAERRKLRKRKLIEYLGGKCSECGYDKCDRALQFHHLDPSTKEFNLSDKGRSTSWEKSLKEADKCVLLCANCHMEVEDGIITLRGRALEAELSHKQL